MVKMMHISTSYCNDESPMNDPRMMMNQLQQQQQQSQSQGHWNNMSVVQQQHHHHHDHDNNIHDHCTTPESTTNGTSNCNHRIIHDNNYYIMNHGQPYLHQQPQVGNHHHHHHTTTSMDHHHHHHHRTMPTVTTSASTAVNHQNEVIPTSNDVLLGRGQSNKDHPGNILFNALIHDNRERYFRTQTPWGKKIIIIEIYDRIVKRNGGRFLSKERCIGTSNDQTDDSKHDLVDVNVSYQILTEELARRKIAHAIQYRQRCTNSGKVPPKISKKVKGKKNNDTIKDDVSTKGGAVVIPTSGSNSPSQQQKLHLVTPPSNGRPLSSVHHPNSFHHMNQSNIVSSSTSPLITGNNRRILDEHMMLLKANQQCLPYISEADIDNFCPVISEEEYEQYKQLITMQMNATASYIDQIKYASRNRSIGLTYKKDIPQNGNIFDHSPFTNHELDLEFHGMNYPLPTIPTPYHMNQVGTKNIVSPLRDDNLINILKRNNFDDVIGDHRNLSHQEEGPMIHRDTYHAISSPKTSSVPHGSHPEFTSLLNLSIDTVMNHQHTNDIDVMSDDELCLSPEIPIQQRTPTTMNNNVFRSHHHDSSNDLHLLAGCSSKTILSPMTPDRDEEQPSTHPISMSALYERSPELFLHEEW